MLLLNLVLYGLAFYLIWLGSGLIINSVSKLSERLKLPSFAVSFLLLGLLTSTPEFSVGLQSIADNDPEIFVGNLIGGIAVLFLLVIPALAIFGKGINLRHELDKPTLAFALLTILTPSVVVVDGKVSMLEGVMLVFLYGVLAFLVQRKNGLFDKSNSRLLNAKSYSHKDVLKIILGIALVFLSSSIIVDKTVYFADIFNISTFYIGLIIVSLGTNIPEISIALRSVVEGKKDIAMGDYLGSAAANTLLFGIFTILNGGEVIIVDNFLVTLLFIAFALSVFYFLSYRKKYISRTNGFMLLGVYVLFVFFELVRR